jgi:pyridoxine 5-phosphate synthase
VRRLTLALDSLCALRSAVAGRDAGLSKAATLAELAGIDALRIGVGEDLSPVTLADVLELRRSARTLELRLTASQPLLKVALEARPDVAVLCAGGREGPGTVAPLDWRSRDSQLAPLVRALAEGCGRVVALVAPQLDAVKAAHGAGVSGVELYTGGLVDLPAAERRSALEGLGDAARLASKLRLEIGLSGNLGFESAVEVVAAAPASERLAVGRRVIERALLVGLDRAIRDFRALIH